MENPNSSSLTSDQSQSSRVIQSMPWQGLLQSVLIVVLFLIGFLIELSPKWDESLIHISVSPGHGFTTQDAAALIPVSLGLFLLVRAVWRYRPIMKRRIKDSPVNAFGVALTIGLTVGVLLGIGLGMVFKIPLVNALKDVLKPIQILIYG